jgi:hypothetical protein
VVRRVARGLIWTGGFRFRRQPCRCFRTLILKLRERLGYGCLGLDAPLAPFFSRNGLVVGYASVSRVGPPSSCLFLYGVSYRVGEPQK